MSQLSLFCQPQRNSSGGYITLPVPEIPVEPEWDACYIFDNLARHKVTQFNHGLHKYPAKFIPQIPRWALQYQRTEGLEMVLDPFCGSGTTLVESGLLGDYAIGYDISPLAVIISRAKTATFARLPAAPTNIIRAVIEEASERVHRTIEALIPGTQCLGLHHTWSYWFRPSEMSKLLALRDAIKLLYEEEHPELAVFLLACLSSIAKSSSFLNEDQIKVRYDKTKTPRDPLEVFPPFAITALETQLVYSRVALQRGAQFSVSVASASRLDQLGDDTIDRVVTSPPYINAVDYTMAHKYNLFILGLVQPDEFKDHCRDYIGLTERAVRARDMEALPETGIQQVDKIASDIRDLDTQVARNRAFVVAQYFQGMFFAFKEMHRVVRPGGRVIAVVGESNKICGHQVATSKMLETLALAAGFNAELRFYHHLANRSSMRLNRHETGGEVKREAIYVFIKS